MLYSIYNMCIHYNHNYKNMVQVICKKEMGCGKVT